MATASTPATRKPGVMPDNDIARPLFSGVASSYEFASQLLSYGQYRRWHRSLWTSSSYQSRPWSWTWRPAPALSPFVWRVGPRSG